MVDKKSRLLLAQHDVNAALKKTNRKIDELGVHSKALCEALFEIQSSFNRISDVKKEYRVTYEGLKLIRDNWKEQAKNISSKYNNVRAKVSIKSTVSIDAMGVSSSYGLATTFGVASSGKSIFCSSTAAVDNAVASWLCGSIFVTNGITTAVGSASLLLLFGPIGLSIIGIPIIANGYISPKNLAEMSGLENVYTLINCRNCKSYESSIAELSERIERIKKETIELREAVKKIESFGINFKTMSKKQQLELGTYVNLMESSTTLLTEPILKLQPDFTEEDFNKVCKIANFRDGRYLKAHKKLIISLANQLFKIPLENEEKNLLVEYLRKNKEFLETIGMTAREFSVEDLNMVELALNHRYKLREY